MQQDVSVNYEPNTRTVSEVAQITGVTVRTLHHYDELGLLVPSERSDAGYRLYTNEDLTRLREILTWRKLGVPLKEIGSLLDDPAADRMSVLLAQRDAVRDQQSELTELAAAIDAAIQDQQKEKPMPETDQKIIDALGGFDPAEYEAEAEERWGDTDAWKQSAARTKNYPAEDWREVKAEVDGIFGALADLFAAGVEPNDPRSREACERHRQHITNRFYDCSPEFHAQLGEMYVADPRFRESLEKGDELVGFAEWLRDAFATDHR